MRRNNLGTSKISNSFRKLMTHWVPCIAAVSALLVVWYVARTTSPSAAIVPSPLLHALPADAPVANAPVADTPAGTAPAASPRAAAFPARSGLDVAPLFEAERIDPRALLVWW